MILGIDTSCYTTSLALIDTDGRLLKDCRRLLHVDDGACGISQSQGFFLHNNQLPQLLAELFQDISPKELKGLAVSVKPRPQEGSYMPVFRAGENIAKIIRLALDIPLFETTHQEGHLAAAIWSNQNTEELGEDFLALHISGGTSELMKAKKVKAGFEIATLSNSDLACGQYIDRVGVALGLPFPAGPHLEKLALECQGTDLTLPVAVRGIEFSFSGPEAAAGRLINKGVDHRELAFAVFVSIGEALAKVIANAMNDTGLKKVLIAGGVASNTIIRSLLEHKIKNGGKIFLSLPEYAKDNAVGVAVLGREKLLCR